MTDKEAATVREWATKVDRLLTRFMECNGYLASPEGQRDPDFEELDAKLRRLGNRFNAQVEGLAEWCGATVGEVTDLLAACVLWRMERAEVTSCA